MIGIVGIIEDVSKAVPSAFQSAGHMIIQLFPSRTYQQFSDRHKDWVRQTYQQLGSSEWARSCMNTIWGKPPSLYIEDEASLHRVLSRLAGDSLIYSASDVSDGGWAVCAAKAGFAQEIGIDSEWAIGSPEPDDYFEPFIEHSSMVLVECKQESAQVVVDFAKLHGVSAAMLGKTTNNVFQIFMEEWVIRTTIRDLKSGYLTALETHLAAEVLA